MKLELPQRKNYIQKTKLIFKNILEMNLPQCSSVLPPHIIHNSKEDMNLLQ